MRKIYFLASTVLLAGSLSAQKINADVNHRPVDVSNSKTSSSSITNQKLVKKAPGDRLWYEDFANGLAGNPVDGLGAPIGGTTAWTKGYTGTTDYGTTWVYENSVTGAGPTGQYVENVGVFESTTSANGYMLWDINALSDDVGDANGFVTADGYIETPEIDISAMPTAIGLQIEHYFITCCAGANYPVDIFAGYYNGVEYIWTAKNSGNAAVEHNIFNAEDNTGEKRLMSIADVANDAQAANTNLDKDQLTITSGGTGYTDGTYNDVNLTGGSGTLATADIVVSGGAITTVNLTFPGSGYAASDILSANDADLGGGGGTGLAITVDGVVTPTIKARFHWNSALDASSSYYFWMIDDVELVELQANDVSLDKMYKGDIYYDFDPYIIPQSQAYPLIVGGSVTNNGGNDATNTQLSVTITEDASTTVVHTGTSNAFTLGVAKDSTFTEEAAELGTAGSNGSLYYNTGKSDFNIGVHTIDISVATDADDDNTNDSASDKIEYSEYEFGHFNPHSPDAGLTRVNSGNNAGAYWSAYPIKADGIVYGLYLNIANGSTTPTDSLQTVTVGLYNPEDLSPYVEQDFIVKSFHIDAGRMSIKFDQAYEVFAGDLVYAGIRAYGSGSNLVIAADFDGDNDNSSLVESNGTLYGTSLDPYVNLSFDPNLENNWVSVQEVEQNGVSLSNSPNPATNSTKVEYSITNTGNVTIEVVDITGKVVRTINEGQKAAGSYSVELNTSDLANGVYYYTLTAGQNKLTNKMIVNK